MIDFIKTTLTLIVTTLLSLVGMFCFGAAIGFWYKVGEFGFTTATKLIEMFI